jgi:hypothetical protein
MSLNLEEVECIHDALAFAIDHPRPCEYKTADGLKVVTKPMAIPDWAKLLRVRFAHCHL